MHVLTFDEETILRLGHISVIQGMVFRTERIKLNLRDILFFSLKLLICYLDVKWLFLEWTEMFRHCLGLGSLFDTR